MAFRINQVLGGFKRVEKLTTTSKIIRVLITKLDPMPIAQTTTTSTTASLPYLTDDESQLEFLSSLFTRVVSGVRFKFEFEIHIMLIVLLGIISVFLSISIAIKIVFFAKSPRSRQKVELFFYLIRFIVLIKIFI